MNTTKDKKLGLYESFLNSNVSEVNLTFCFHFCGVKDFGHINVLQNQLCDFAHTCFGHSWHCFGMFCAVGLSRVKTVLDLLHLVNTQTEPVAARACVICF